MSAAHAASTAGPTLLVSHEPPLTGACGNSESPSSKRTLPVPTPIAAAVIWVMPVYVPVPISCVAERTTTRPSLHRLARAAAGICLAGYAAVAKPQPTSRRPSSERMERGVGLRRAQPKRSAACW